MRKRRLVLRGDSERGKSWGHQSYTSWLVTVRRYRGITTSEQSWEKGESLYTANTLSLSLSFFPSSSTSSLRFVVFWFTWSDPHLWNKYVDNIRSCVRACGKISSPEPGTDCLWRTRICCCGKFGKRSAPVIVPHSVNCFYGKVGKRSALTNVNSDRGFESWPGYEVKPPDCQSSLEAHGQWKLEFPATGRIIRSSSTTKSNKSKSPPKKNIFCLL